MSPELVEYKLYAPEAVKCWPIQPQVVIGEQEKRAAFRSALLRSPPASNNRAASAGESFNEVAPTAEHKRILARTHYLFGYRKAEAGDVAAARPHYQDAARLFGEADLALAEQIATHQYRLLLGRSGAVAMRCVPQR